MALSDQTKEFLDHLLYYTDEPEDVEAAITSFREILEHLGTTEIPSWDEMVAYGKEAFE